LEKLLMNAIGEDALKQLFTEARTANGFTDKPGLAAATAVRGTTLSGAYFMLAARALGVDCGSMSGFDGGKVDATFFPDGRHQTDFLLNLGYADHSKTFKRNPRLSFEQAVTLLT